MAYQPEQLIWIPVVIGQNCGIDQIKFGPNSSQPLLFKNIVHAIYVLVKDKIQTPSTRF